MIGDCMKPDANCLHDCLTRKYESLLTVYMDPQGSKWEMRFNKMKEFLDKYDCFPYDIEYDQLDDEGKRALEWTRRQKAHYRAYRNGSTITAMTQERIKKLEGVGFTWNKYDEIWMQRYRDLLKYYKHHGHSLVPATYPANPRLSKWVSEQRTNRRFLEQGKFSSAKHGNSCTTVCTNFSCCARFDFQPHKGTSGIARESRNSERREERVG